MLKGGPNRTLRFGPPSIITLPFPGFQMFQNTAPPWESIRPETGTALPPHFSSESALFALVWKWKGNRRRHRQPRNKDERCMRLPQARSSDQPAFLYGQSSDCDNCTPGNCMIRFEPEDDHLQAKPLVVYISTRLRKPPWRPHLRLQEKVIHMNHSKFRVTLFHLTGQRCLSGSTHSVQSDHPRPFSILLILFAAGSLLLFFLPPYFDLVYDTRLYLSYCVQRLYPAFCLFFSNFYQRFHETCHALNLGRNDDLRCFAVRRLFECFEAF